LQQNAALAAIEDDAQPWFAHGPQMSQLQFNFFRDFVKLHAGISLPDFKRNMVHRRIAKRLAALQIGSFADYQTVLESPAGAQEVEFFVNALTTNKTSFFREQHHFEHLAREGLPLMARDAAARGDDMLRIWSAGCSLGQEAYSIAITATSRCPDVTFKILATDIDTEALLHAQTGIYSAEDLLDVPASAQTAYFEPLDRSSFGVKSSLHDKVVFNPLNLHGNWPMRRKFDIIFCRNVIIYFDKTTQKQLFDRFADVMHENAFLYIGHSESLYKVSERFQPLGQSIYRKIA
jgi:chemotaxis protein methyltransferase CheR